MKIKAVVVLIGAFLLGAPIVFGQGSGYENEILNWRAKYQEKLLADDGWLTVAGLSWLLEGVNTVGNGETYDVRLTASFGGAKFGEITLARDSAKLSVENGVTATVAGQPVGAIELSPKEGKPPIIEVGSQSFFLIKREDRIGIRVRDRKNPSRLNFAGLSWYSVDPAFRVEADFEPFDEPREILVPNVLGGNFKYKSPGLLVFRIKGKKYTLQPVEEGEKLFIIFRDSTSRSETYGAGRFLYSAKPVDGKVTLDFNKAENPPCAYTPFATCPLPPPQNRLSVAIKAGEKRFDH
ncbi:MAG: DUF1684 domain-containing protein [Pyrinomonadaceae bacterium]